MSYITTEKRRAEKVASEYQAKYGPLFKSMKPVSADQQKALTALCQKNAWLKIHGIPFVDDPFLELDSPYSFSTIEDIEMLKLYFEHGNWSIRNGVVYKDLFFCNQVDGGDEWWTCRYDPETGSWVPFESITFSYFVNNGTFNDYINRMLAATVEQCAKLAY